MNKRKAGKPDPAPETSDAGLWDRVKRSVDPLDPRHRGLYSQALADFFGREAGSLPARATPPAKGSPPADPGAKPSGRQGAIRHHEKGQSAAMRRSTMPAYTPTRPASPASPPLVELDRKGRKRIARGRTAIDARLDLHGLRQHEAHEVLRAFIWRAYGAGQRTVLVITGKGLRPRDPHPDAPPWAEGSGVLRKAVPGWLAASDLRPLVLGVEPAHANHGGDGALYVRLRARKPQA